MPHPEPVTVLVEELEGQELIDAEADPPRLCVTLTVGDSEGLVVALALGETDCEADWLPVAQPEADWVEINDREALALTLPLMLPLPQAEAVLDSVGEAAPLAEAFAVPLPHDDTEAEAESDGEVPPDALSEPVAQADAVVVED